jgi:catalase
VITEDLDALTKTFAEMIALHRFWDREVQRKIPA